METSQFSTIFHNFHVSQNFTNYLIVNYLGSLAHPLQRGERKRGTIATTKEVKPIKTYQK